MLQPKQHINTLPRSLSMNGSAIACMPTRLSSVTASTYRSCQQQQQGSNNGKFGTLLVPQLRSPLSRHGPKQHACLHRYLAMIIYLLTHQCTCTETERYAFVAAEASKSSAANTRSRRTYPMYCQACLLRNAYALYAAPGKCRPARPPLAVPAAHTGQPALRWHHPCEHGRHLHMHSHHAVHTIWHYNNAAARTLTHIDASSSAFSPGGIWDNLFGHWSGKVSCKLTSILSTAQHTTFYTSIAPQTVHA
jgi:hypothetical protein